MDTFGEPTAARTFQRKRHRNYLNLITSTSAVSAAMAIISGLPATALAQTAKPQSATVEPSVEEEIVVTGSRIVREGYEAPTPLTVFGRDQMEQSASPNLMSILNSIPALSGSQLTTSNIVTANGSTGLQGANLRSLGSNRVLVLLDGQRTVGATFAGVPDIGSFPQQLVARVDVVTGGASAVYGSDAITGVMNFVLDKSFTGVKAEVSGGVTNYGDDKNYKVDVSAGFAFAGGRGHVLLSGQQLFNEGVQGAAKRAHWTSVGALQIVNPAYTATNGQPQQLWITENAGIGGLTPGGIISAGPLKGTAFGAGGTPFQFRYGSIYANPNMVGGDWQHSNMRPYADQDPKQSNQSVFTRVSYDLADNVNAYVQYGFAQNHAVNGFNYIFIVGGSAQSPTIRIDNAYLPASVRAAMTANNITSFPVGTWNRDYGRIGNDNLYITNRAIGGLEGTFDAFNTSWTWNANYAYGATMMKAELLGGMVLSRYRLATDAVVNPANGQIVCRVTLTNPSDPCRPWNVMGIGVNEGNAAGKAYMEQPNFQRGLIELETYSASITGEPFNVPAGPVSLAISFEHRKDEIHVANDPYSAVGDRPFGNVPSLNGAQSVTEAALETVVPLANGETWAQSWDISAAARFTDYELSGFVTTYKFGSTYAPVDDIRFRVTYSRDIRAPNLQELFATVTTGGGATQIIDRFQNDRSYPLAFTRGSGNPNLDVEKANTIGIGVVLSPRFLDGFTVSVDYWDVNIKGAIQSIAPQQTIDSCFSGKFPDLCSAIVRDPVTGNMLTVSNFPINLATRNVSGLDLEASYRTPVSSLVSDWEGDLSFHGLMTVYLRNYEDNTFTTPTDRVGENGGPAPANPPFWKLDATAAYALEPLTFSLTGRAISSGYINRTYIECTSGCPTSTIDHPTINNNRIAGRFYLDASVSYDFALGETASSEVFLSAKNIFNRDPPLSPSSFFNTVSQLSVLYDVLGTVYRAGIRFRM